MSSTNNNESLFELVSVSQLEQNVPKVLYKGTVRCPIFKFRRIPTLEELHQLTTLMGFWSIWQANETLILNTGEKRLLNQELSCCDGHKVVLADDDKYLSFHSGSLECTVIGKSEHAIAETAAFLWRLDICNESRCISGRHFDFSVVSLEQLSLFFQTPPTTDYIGLHLSNISPAQSKFLAQVPYPTSVSLINLGLGSFSDGGHAFVEALLERDSPFGSLELSEIKESHGEIFDRLLQVEILDTLSIQLSSLSSRRTRQLLSTAVRGLNFGVWVASTLRLDWSVVDIIPKELAVGLVCYYDVETHQNFVLAFLRRIAELGDFVKLNLGVWDGVMPDIVNELIHVVDSNHGLVALRLNLPFTDFPKQFEDLLTTMEHHKGLRRFILDKEYPNDPDYSTLKRLLKRNRFIEVFQGNGDLVTDGDEIDRLYEFNRFFRGLQDFTKKPLSLVPPLVGEALIHSASSDFQRSALVMANHADALCELVQYSLYNAEETPSFSSLSNAGSSSLPVENGNE